MNAFALKGNLLYTKTKTKIECLPHAYLVCEDGRVAGTFAALPEQYAHIPVEDCGDALIIPGLIDLHLHAPQYAFRGLGMDLELLEWLNTHTFPEEAKYADLEYAARAYEIFAEDLRTSATTRACIFGTIHLSATMLLMEQLEKTGVRTMVGKVNMDRNSPDYYREETQQSLQQTAQWLERCSGKFENTQPILTPRFTPSCTDALMQGLSLLQKKYGLPVQSHLSENSSEITWVQELCPDTRFYGEAYDTFGLFGGGCKTVMAHCVHSDEREIALMRERGVYIAHCPQSNENLSSGAAPARSYLELGVKIGLGSDIAGGYSLSIFRAMSDAIQVSKLRWRLLDDTKKPLTVPEVFYLGTKGGGEFFGKVGSFEAGYAFDAVVLDDSMLMHPQPLTLEERLTRVIYLSDSRSICQKYVAGKKVVG